MSSNANNTIVLEVCRAIGAAANCHEDRAVDPATRAPCGPLAVFTSSAVPGCSLEYYAEYIARNVHQKEAVPLGVVLLMRLWRTSGAAPTPKTVHRLLLGCVSVAMKAHYDDFYVSRYMARVGSVTAHELGLLEARVLELLEWSVQVRRSELASMTEELATLGRRVKGANAAADAGVGRCVGHLAVASVPAPPMDRLVPQASQLPQFCSLEALPAHLSPSHVARGGNDSSAYLASAGPGELSITCA